MRKRNAGYILLALLVVTGLAGTLSGSISQKERKLATSLMKESRNELLKTLEGLTEEQWNFKPSAEKWSVKECMYHLALSETNLWKIFENTMASLANPEKRYQINMTDDDIVTRMEDRNFKLQAKENALPQNASYKSGEEAIAAFKKQRDAAIKYMRLTTEDMRDHILQHPLGWMDAYQFYIFIGAHTSRHLLQIEEIKANPAFPR